MLRTTLRKLSLPLLGASAAALMLFTATAVAGSGVGDVFNLGQVNTVNGTSTLTGNTSGGPQLKVVNTNTTNHTILAQAGGGSGIALFGLHTTTAGNGPAIRGESASTAVNAFSIYGLLSPTAPGAPSAAIRAESKSTGANGYGLWASQAGTGSAVYATSPSGTGVYGKHTTAGGSGPGVRGDSASALNAGVLGVNTAGGPGLQAIANSGVAPLKVSNSILVPNLNADLLDGKDSAGFWALGGNPTASTGVLGTTTNQPLDLRVNNLRALRVEPDATSPNLIGGFSGNGNTAGSGAFGLTIAGGGESFSENVVSDNFGTIGGGEANLAGDNGLDPTSADEATVGGGVNNSATGQSSTVGGGRINTASGYASVVAGGGNNIASGYASAVAGGGAGTASGNQSFVGAGASSIASGNQSFVGGGAFNTASSQYAAVPGGRSNTASGQYSFAAGRQAKATQPGSFVWGDSTAADVTSPAADTFTVRASGGTFIQGKANVSGALSTGVGTFPADSTNPSVSGGNVFLTNNTVNPTTINSFTGGTAGQTITIVFTDANTTVQDNSGTIFLQGNNTNFDALQNDTLTLVSPDGTKWYEVSRSVNGS
jgi:hypothetical protein